MQTIQKTTKIIILGALLMCVPVTADAQGNGPLSDLQAQIDALQEQIDALEIDDTFQDQIDALGNVDGTLQAQIDALQTQIDGIQQSKSIVEESNSDNLFLFNVAQGCVSSPTSVTIDVPSSGKVFVDAMVAATYQDPHAELHLSSSMHTCDSPFGSVVIIKASGLHEYAQHVARRVFTVPAGTHTFYLNTVKFNANNTQLRKQNLRAVFVPD